MIRRMIVFWLFFAGILTIAAQGDDANTDVPITTENAAAISQNAVLEGHTMPVMALSFDASGRYLASGADDISLRVWDVVAGEQIAELYPHTAFVRAVAFSPVDDLLLSGSWDRRLVVYDAATMPPEEQQTLADFSHIIEPIVFTASGDQFAFGVGQGEVHLLNSADFSTERVYMVDGLSINDLAFSPGEDNTTLLLASATGYPANVVEFWSATDDERIGFLPQDVDTAPVTALAFSPTTTGPYLLAAGDETAMLTLWAVEDLDGTASIQALGRVEADDWITSVAFHPNGEILATATLSGMVSLWDVRQPDAPERLIDLPLLDSAVNVVVFNAAGSLLAAGSDDGTIYLWGSHNE